MRAILFDTETSAKENGEVIELSYCDVYESGNGTIGSKAVVAPPSRSSIFTTRFRPERGMTYGACAVHHILPVHLQHCAPFSSDVLPAADVYIGHNVDFDLAFFPNRTPARTIDTLALFRRFLPAGEHTLSAAYYYVAGMNPAAREIATSAHGAEADVKMTFELLSFLSATFECYTFDALANLSDEARIPTHMTFGKFKGQPVSEVDNGWRGWYRKQPDPDPYLLEAFDRYPYSTR